MSHATYLALKAASKTLRPDLEALRASGAAPRLHPNGFIQVDLSSDTRAHVWPKVPMPTRQPFCPIHDHVYGFESLIAVGVVRNVEYEPVEDPEGGFQIWEVLPWAAERRTSFPRPVDEKRYRLREISDAFYGAEIMYGMQPFVFHLSDVTGPAVTVLKILPFERGRSARIAAPIGAAPDTRFDRDVTPERQAELWGHVFATIPK